jgi:hypothetical protein
MDLNCLRKTFSKECPASFACNIWLWFGWNSGWSGLLFWFQNLCYGWYFGVAMMNAMVGYVSNQITSAFWRWTFYADAWSGYVAKSVCLVWLCCYAEPCHIITFSGMIYDHSVRLSFSLYGLNG